MVLLLNLSGLQVDGACILLGMNCLETCRVNLADANADNATGAFFTLSKPILVPSSH
jgi:hypothetical protein